MTLGQGSEGGEGTWSLAGPNRQQKQADILVRTIREGGQGIAGFGRECWRSFGHALVSADLTQSDKGN